MLFICYLKEEMALKCPFCNYNDTKVIDSRGQEDNSVIPVSYTHLTLPTICSV